MTPKYLQDAVNKLKAVKTGMAAHAAQWVGQPIATTDIDTAITTLETNAASLEAAQSNLSKLQETIHGVVDDQSLVADQAETLARGIHIKEPEKLVDYGIAKRKDATPVPVPGMAVISSIEDDVDGEGFIITTQPLPNAADFEIWRGVSATPDLQVLAPETYSFLTATKKLTYTDDNVLKGTRYFYRIRGFNRTGKGEWSAPVSRVQ